MLSRRPFAAALTLALVAPVTALTASPAASAAHAASAAPAASSTGKRIAAKRLPRPLRDKAHTRAHEAHTVLVKFRTSAPKTRRDHAVASHGGRVAQALPGTGFVKVTTSGRAEDLARRLKADPTVAEVALDYVRKASASPNDPAFAYGDQDYLQTVRVPSAWDRSKGSLSQVVAVIDTGVNGRHPDLAGRTVAGYNAITNASIAAGAASDDNGHGSMVSGIIAAGTDNGEGIAGVAWNAKVMPVKVLDRTGSGADSDIVEGIDWAVSHGAKILNLSLGGDGDSPALHDAVKNAVAKGAVVVVAAGNSGDDVTQYPAAYPEAVAVGATDTSGALTDFSTYGSWVDIAAPGWGILSTGIPDSSGNDYFYGDGTSFAAPIVSGVAALIRTQSPTLTPAQVLSRLKSTARDAGPRGIDPYYGAGIVDATNALGGGWAADFGFPAMGAGEPNDVPSRATLLADSATGIVSVEGDVDWYRIVTDTTQPLSVTVTPPAEDPNLPQNEDPEVSVYDSALRPVTTSDHQGAGGAELVGWTAPAGTSYVRIENFNGARVARPYTVSLNRRTGALLNSPSWLYQRTPQTGSTAVGDVTGDGRDDVVATLGESSDAVTPRGIIVYAQASAPTPDDGTFYPTADDSPVTRVAVADLDGDGTAEVLAGTLNGLQVFHRQADGTLGTASSVASVPGLVRDVAVGDVDGDGHPDLVTSMSATTSILIHQPDGTYTKAIDVPGQLVDLSIADVDGDGRPDVVGTDGASAVVLHNDPSDPTGWRVTKHPVTLSSGSTVGAARILDADRDGRPDVVALVRSASGSARLATFLQGADGTLQGPTSTAMPAYSETLAVADVNGDGVPDLVTSGRNPSPNVSVLPGLAGGGFGAPVSTPTGDSISSAHQGELSTGDLDGDGHPDVALMTRTDVAVLRNATAATVPGQPALSVRSTTPSDFASSLAPSYTPTVTFAGDVNGTTVNASTVRLLDGHTGSAVPATVTYDAVMRTATVRPTTALYDNAPYRLTVSGVKDTAGGTMPTAYSVTFRTVDVTPPAVGSFTATGTLRGATLTWKAPTVNDLDRYIVRMAPGTTPPASVTTGTAAYSGTATSANVANLAQGTTYSFRIWARDRSGKLSAPSSRTLVGTTETMTSNVTSLAYAGSVTVSSRLTRPDTGGSVVGVPVQLYWRRAGTTTWNLLTTRTSSSTGTVSYAHKPATSVEYLWIYRGSTSFVGSSSALRAVGVRTAVTGVVSRSSLALGGTFTMSGSVSPTHVGQGVYLQRYAGSGKWTTVTSKPLGTTSAYAFSVKPSARGTFTYRVYKPADTDHLASYSASRAVRVY
ncbi:S8 family serine peptidase [Terrabacter sp. BE26]|uniref:S8 family serine peptidase n=1 Tax=Terrabacter sp. BE26 TaxID=2898152 RepID=UPI0035BE838E